MSFIPSIVTGQGLNAEVWRTSGEFPENSLKALQEKESLGLAFSGGGTRSASATLGQLSALHKIGIIERAKYISAVSGGGWASIPFSFLPETIPDEDFFGEIEADPSKVTQDKLNRIGQRSFGEAIIHTVALDDAVHHAFRMAGDETYARAIGNLFLKPFGLDDLKKSFTYNHETMALSDPSLSYYTTKNNRPFLIVGGSVITKYFEKIPIEYTPYYTGIRTHFKRGKKSYGGCYVSSYAYDSHEPRTEFPCHLDSMKIQTSKGSLRDKALSKITKNRFTLSDIAGSTGAAPQEVLEKLNFKSVGFPDFYHWGLNEDEKSFCEASEKPHADGGSLENTGVMPLLARQTKRIISFVNTKKPFSYNEATGEVIMDSSLKKLFEPVGGKISKDDAAFNIVLEGGHEKYVELVKAFKKKQDNGETLIHTGAYKVMRNERYGVNVPYEARITWIYNNRVDNWEKDLPVDVRSQVGKKGGEFERFPHYKTFLENPPAVIDLSTRQVNLLSYLSHWNVIHNQDELLT